MITSGQLIQQTAILSLILAAGGIVSSFFNSRRRGRVFAFFAGTVGLCSTVLMLINDSRPDDFEYKLGSMEFSLDAISIFFIATIGLGIFFFSLFIILVITILTESLV